MAEGYKLVKQSIDITGVVSGRLTAIKPVGKIAGEGHIRWLCKCSCGEESIVRASEIKTGRVKSCGCFQIDQVKSSVRLPTGEAAFNSIYSQYARNATTRKLEFSLTKDEFAAITKQHCYYCGSLPKQCTGKKAFNGDYVYNGIDRVNNSQGYTTSNTVPCCGLCNRMKMELPQDVFLAHILAITRNRSL